MVKVGINGFGRIGRLATRIALLKHSGDMDIVAINTSGSMNVSDIFSYDTTYASSKKKFVLKK